MSLTSAGWRLAAAVTAAGLLTLGAAAPAIAQQQALPIVDGAADWGVKESFRSYVTGPIAGGQITASDGATENADGTFRFGSGTGEYDPATHDLTAGFEGTVQFQGHASGDEWELDLTISNIEVSTDNADQTGELTADVVGRDLSTGEYTEYPGVTLAELDLSGVSPEPGEDGSVTLAGIPAVLAEDGADAFAGFYQAGAELDPVTVTVLADAAPRDGDGNGDGDGDGDGNGSGGDGDGGGGDQADPDTYQVTDGNLDWGFKESFRSYVTGPVANGSITVSGGAVDNGGSYRFVDGDGALDTEAQTLAASFAGAVAFTGHDGELAVTIDDVSVRVDGDEAVLYTGELAFADLTLPSGGLVVEDDVLSLPALPATLTADGSNRFEYNGSPMYPAGEQLDPVTIHLALSDRAALPGPGGSGGGLALTGTPLAALLAAGATLLLAGSGIVWLTRRRAAVAG